MKKTLLFFFLFFNQLVNAKWIEIPGASTPKFNIKDQIAVGSKKNIWTLGLEDKPYQWTGSDWVGPQGSIKDIDSISATQDGNVYALERKKYDEETWNLYKTLDFRDFHEKIETGKIIPDYTQSLFHWNGKKWIPVFDTKDLGTAKRIAAIKKDSVLIIVNGKMYHWNGKTTKQLGTIDGFISMACSNDGTLWGITRAETDNQIIFSILKWDGKQWELITQFKRSPVNQFVPEELAIIDKDNVLMTSGDRITDMKIYKWNPQTNQFKPMDNKKGFTFVAAAPDGTIWAPHWNHKIYQWK